MAIDICKILSRQGISSAPNLKSVSAGVEKAIGRNHKRLMCDTFVAVTQDMGIKAKYAPDFHIFTEPVRKNGCYRNGFFHPWVVHANDFLLVNYKEHIGVFMDFVGCIYHETRHFVQDALYGKNRGISDRIVDLLSFSSQGAFTHYEKAVPVLSAEDKKLVSQITAYDKKKALGYSKIDSSGNLTKEYMEDPAEIDANKFASKKMKELLASIGESELPKVIIVPPRSSEFNKPIKFKNINNSSLKSVA